MKHLILLLSLFMLNIYASDSSNKTTPLGWAIINKDTKQAIELINNGADLRVYDNEGKNNAENEI